MKRITYIAMCLVLLASLGTPAPLLAAGAQQEESIQQVVTKVNINAASSDELQNVPGIGATLAERIVAFRTEHGPFKTPDDLTQVRGIGEKNLVKLLPWLSVK